MSKRKNGLPPPARSVDGVASGDVGHDDVARDNVEDDDAASVDAASSSKPAARTAGGRFAPGHCPNPKGRPRKRLEAGSSLLADILDEEIEVGTGGQRKRMTMREVTLRSLCARATKDAVIALAVLKLDASSRQAARVDEVPEDPEAARTWLQGFVERETRRRTLSEARAAAKPAEDDDGEDDDGEDSAGEGDEDAG